jgi:hypothetical protein
MFYLHSSARNLIASKVYRVYIKIIDHALPNRHIFVPVKDISYALAGTLAS